MKIRKGYVSNSSSSSFICDISGGIEVGYDLTMEDADMWECENGHTMYDSYVKYDSEKELVLEYLRNDLVISKSSSYRDDHAEIEYIIEEIDKVSETDFDINDYENFIEYGDLRYKLPAKFCPICSMEKFKKDELITFLLKETNTTLVEISLKIKEQFNDYDSFKNFIK